MLFGEIRLPRPLTQLLPSPQVMCSAARSWVEGFFTKGSTRLSAGGPHWNILRQSKNFSAPWDPSSHLLNEKDLQSVKSKVSFDITYCGEGQRQRKNVSREDWFCFVSFHPPEERKRSIIAARMKCYFFKHEHINPACLFVTIKSLILWLQAAYIVTASIFKYPYC